MDSNIIILKKLGNFEIVSSLHQFLSKFHLINPIGKDDPQLLNTIEEFVRASNKVLYYNDIIVKLFL